MTKEHEASRTLVKSPPELWAECSDAGSLARHLGEFGEITITRLEPETTVAWEGEHASGTVQIEPSGWGTRVTLRAQTSWEEPEAPPPEPAAEAEAEPEIEARSIEPEVQPVEETEHAEMEEAVEDPEDGGLEDTGRARPRWRRITARMRRVLTGRESEEATDGEGTDDPGALMDSLPPIEDQAGLEAESEAEAKLPAAPERVAESEPEAGSEPEAEVEPEAEAEPERLEPAAPGLDADAILTSALESLGQAHHRPFSRA